MTHALKCWPEYFVHMAAEIKNFQLRKDDRPFEIGDTVLLQEWDHDTGKYSGKELKFEISYILRDAAKMGLKPGFCILALTAKDEEK